MQNVDQACVHHFQLIYTECAAARQGCVFTRNIDAAIAISDAMETGTVQVNSAPARGPDHFPFQGFRDSGMGSQGIKNSLLMMTKDKSTVGPLSLTLFALA